MNKVLASIKRGLEQAIAHQEGRPAKIRVHRIPDIIDREPKAVLRALARNGVGAA